MEPLAEILQGSQQFGRVPPHGLKGGELGLLLADRILKAGHYGPLSSNRIDFRYFKINHLRVTDSIETSDSYRGIRSSNNKLYLVR